MEVRFPVLDSYIGDIYWEIKKGLEILSNGNYEGTACQPVQSGECYDFIIYDAYDDGLCDEFLCGYYEIWWDATKFENYVFKSTGQYGSQEYRRICDPGLMTVWTVVGERIRDLSYEDYTSAIVSHVARSSNLVTLIQHQVVSSDTARVTIHVADSTQELEDYILDKDFANLNNFYMPTFLDTAAYRTTDVFISLQGNINVVLDFSRTNNFQITF